MDKIESYLQTLLKTKQELTKIEFENLGVSHKKFYVYELAQIGAKEEVMNYLYDWPLIEKCYKEERKKLFK